MVHVDKHEKINLPGSRKECKWNHHLPTIYRHAGTKKKKKRLQYVNSLTRTTIVQTYDIMKDYKKKNKITYHIDKESTAIFAFTRFPVIKISIL